jgi:tRNA-intron endonuclease, archaea type
MNAIQALLVENRIIVCNIEHSRELFSNGFYGKPLGIAKPKSTLFDTRLILDLIEGCYLVHTKKLRLTRPNGEQIPFKEIKAICRREYVNFDNKYLVFQRLRDHGYVVSPGIKFGCDFAVYEQGPGLDHAPFLIEVFSPAEYMSATGIVLAGRLATTVKKQFIIAIPRIKEKKVDFIGFDWWRA